MTGLRLTAEQRRMIRRLSAEGFGGSSGCHRTVKPQPSRVEGCPGPPMLEKGAGHGVRRRVGG